MFFQVLVTVFRYFADLVGVSRKIKRQEKLGKVKSKCKSGNSSSFASNDEELT